jgi:hypothetical protein
MDECVKSFERSRSNTLRRRSLGYEFGIFFFELDQPAKERIILGVADLGGVEDVIAMVGFVDLRAQFARASLSLGE